MTHVAQDGGAAPVTPQKPGAGLVAERMPGHWLLARLGKRVLRPGGVELTRWMLDALSPGRHDHVVELAAGLGATARLVLERSPATYTGVDRDPAAVATLARLRAPAEVDFRQRQADAAGTGLPDGCATVVYGEAMLTMQPEPAKRRIVAEAYRLLAGSGRYGIHELCLRPDDLDPAVADEINDELSRIIHVGARPLTVAGWRDLLTEAGLRVVDGRQAPMHLLEPRRMVADEGLWRSLAFAGRVLRDPAARRRVRAMRRLFHRHQAHLGAVALVAQRPD